VEAAGIEPASRDPSTTASTCVVDNLDFADAGSYRQDPASTSRKRFLGVSVLDMTDDDSELVTSFQGSPKKPISQGCLLLGGHCEVTFSN